MAKAKKDTSKKKTKTGAEGSEGKKKWSLSRRNKVLIGVLSFLFAVAMLLSFISYFLYGSYDQSEVTALAERNEVVHNWLGKFGAYLADLFLYHGFGAASFILVRFFFLLGAYLVLGLPSRKLKRTLFWDLFLTINVSVLFGFFSSCLPELGGIIGYEINLFLQDYLGKTGTLLLLIFGFFTFLLFKVKMSPDAIKALFERKKKEIEEENNDIENAVTDSTFSPTVVAAENSEGSNKTKSDSLQEVNTNNNDDDNEWENMQLKTVEETPVEEAFDANSKIKQEESSEIDLSPVKKESETKTDKKAEKEEEFVIEQAVEEDSVEENQASKLVQDFGEFDPTLELSNYQLPSIELLRDHASGGITINQEELEENKNRIVDTLKNYKIDIAQIKATVGPTVTLYEIVPEAGVRISKIKNLEDDIALSLSALGIRIIAPIPGKGTIGIEVPNQKPTIVSAKSAIASPKFQNAEMELPIALGKTISNETFVVDLAKMPHLLMAGATGQGKSVGLNMVLTSLLYKKHPAEVKFVLVDPKKVELTLFNKIERHYLAKLPDSDDAIITDNSKVITTLNSLCVEMDNRYNLLKDAMVRNIKEYNEKFKQRKLNPENGHRFLPYIVLVVDEFADLIMTAGKEVETPIARLAQLARAIGIHLIIATQRPSVNVITGIIKANFPARIAFRVTSKIDSRTILDSQGADQLIGRGDLLYTQGNDLTRVQCAFVDTPEVEKITEFIGSQKAYPDAYLLPEYQGEESGTNLDIDVSERDSMFREAAEVLVTAQQGSASLLQRKLKLGYNRAGRLIDQLEAAGIVGPFEGSKARSVLIPDLQSLEQFFANEENS
ncbi:DNA translocase FtsK [Flavobacterium suaedae]|uniref:DNA translocase FtsK n=1 Tax=Flavobacterium suaedae TaxID=1767027 RepID=A0ABQ1JH13_9FLAO|nr:DNA translocase FtsK [Flavobacterium suaedae]GGB66999.1 DNA translocase FtsK [Flavobacterium suaedae]